MESIFYIQRCKNNNCNFYQNFTISLNSYDKKGKCIISEKKKTFFLQMQKCQMITFVKFEKIANENCIILLKERRKENS